MAGSNGKWGAQHPEDGGSFVDGVYGALTLSIVLLASAIWVAMLALMLLALGVTPGPITTGNLIILILTVLGFVFIWREFWHPWFRVVNDCVVKAPLWLTAISEKNSCELEMFRQGKYRWTRLVRFSADCPICGSNIELRPGKPDQNLPLVGRCIESPYAHVYSFDRMTLQGTYLGPSMPSKPYAPSPPEESPTQGARRITQTSSSGRPSSTAASASKISTRTSASAARWRISSRDS